MPENTLNRLFSVAATKFRTLVTVKRRDGIVAAFKASCSALSRLLSYRWNRVTRVMSVLITQGDASTEALAATVASLRAQTHPYWRLMASPGVAGRCRPAGPMKNLVVLVAAGDVLHPEALAELARAAEADPLADVMYTDEEQAQSDGAPEPFFKPEWSPELLLSMPYVLHCLGVRRRLFTQLRGLDPTAGEAAVYSFALRATAAARRVGHVPRVLCRRPASPSAGSRQPDDDGLRVVSALAAALDPPADAAQGAIPGTYRLVRRQHQRPTVTLVVLSGDPVSDIEGRGEVRILANFLASVAERSTYPDYRVLVADDGELSEETLAVMSRVDACRVSCPPPSDPQEPFNFSRKVNFALARLETEYFVLLNDDLEVVTPGWIEALMDYAVMPAVGAVGAHLVFADGRTQHAGVIANPGGPTHRFYGCPPEATDGHGPAEVVRNMSAVTAAVIASRLEVIAATGPFDETLARHYNDVDFCLRVRQRGYHIVYTPFARLCHFEHTSLRLPHPAFEELALFEARWDAWCRNDPYYRRP